MAEEKKVDTKLMATIAKDHIKDPVVELVSTIAAVGEAMGNTEHGKSVITGATLQMAITMIVGAVVELVPDTIKDMGFAMEKWRDGVDKGVLLALKHRKEKGDARDPDNGAHEEKN